MLSLAQAGLRPSVSYVKAGLAQICVQMTAGCRTVSQGVAHGGDCIGSGGG